MCLNKIEVHEFFTRISSRTRDIEHMLFALMPMGAGRGARGGTVMRFGQPSTWADKNSDPGYGNVRCAFILYICPCPPLTDRAGCTARGTQRTVSTNWGTADSIQQSVQNERARSWPAASRSDWHRIRSRGTGAQHLVVGCGGGRQGGRREEGGYASAQSRNALFRADCTYIRLALFRADSLCAWLTMGVGVAGCERGPRN